MAGAATIPTAYRREIETFEQSYETLHSADRGQAEEALAIHQANLSSYSSGPLSSDEKDWLGNHMLVLSSLAPVASSHSVTHMRYDGDGKERKGDGDRRTDDKKRGKSVSRYTSAASSVPRSTRPAVSGDGVDPEAGASAAAAVVEPCRFTFASRHSDHKDQKDHKEDGKEENGGMDPASAALAARLRLSDVAEDDGDSSSGDEDALKPLKPIALSDDDSDAEGISDSEAEDSEAEGDDGKGLGLAGSGKPEPKKASKGKADDSDSDHEEGTLGLGIPKEVRSDKKEKESKRGPTSEPRQRRGLTSESGLGQLTDQAQAPVAAVHEEPATEREEEQRGCVACMRRAYNVARTWFSTHRVGAVQGFIGSATAAIGAPLAASQNSTYSSYVSAACSFTLGAWLAVEAGGFIKKHYPAPKTKHE